MTPRLLSLGVSGLVLLSLVLLPRVAPAQDACQGLTSAAIPRATIVAATSVPASATTKAPAFCEVRATLAAHHAVGGQFDMSKTMSLTGTVSRIDWRNPHPAVQLDVTGTSGLVQWTLLTHPPAMLLELGVNKGLLAGRPGETVTAIVHPALNGRRMGWVARLTYADGHFFSLSEL